jgi:hypothetical protein
VPQARKALAGKRSGTDRIAPVGQIKQTGLLPDLLQHVDHIAEGLDVVKPAGHQQALHDTDLLGAELRPTKQPVPLVMRGSANAESF